MFKFTSFIRTIRLNRQLTLAAVGSAVSIDKSDLSKIELCKARATTGQRLALEKFYSLGWEALIRRHGPHFDMGKLQQAFADSGIAL